MDEQEEKINSLLLDFEMNGITPRQKNVMEREIKRLLQTAGRKRDALEVNRIRSMRERLEEIKLSRPINIFDYIKDVFIESKQKVYTLFDIVGIALFFFPSLAESLITNLPLTRAVGGLIFFVSFIGANFSLYKNSHNG